MNRFLSYSIFFVFLTFSLFGVFSLKYFHENGSCALPALGSDECPAALSETALAFHHLNGFQAISLSAFISLFLFLSVFLVFKIISIHPGWGKPRLLPVEKYEEVRYLARRFILKFISYLHRRDPEILSRGHLPA